MKYQLKYSIFLGAIIASSGCTNGSNSSGANVVENEPLTISAQVYGLSDNEMVTLVDAKNQNNRLSVTKNGSHLMPNKLKPGSSYDLTILQQPQNKSCTVSWFKHI